jgi:4-hydroxyacetophenone monooxygenase
VFDETIARWQVSWTGRAGQAHSAECRSLITAVGQLNRPAIPAIKGLETFRGPAFHTAQWDHRADLKASAWR